MGNIFPKEDKLQLQQHDVNLERNVQRMVKLYQQYGNHYSDSTFDKPNNQIYKKRRNVSFNERYGRSEYYRKKSCSLNAILEELYSLDPEENVQTKKTHIEIGALIPRVKLKRSTSSLKEERNYKTLCKMSSESALYVKTDFNNSISDILRKSANISNDSEPRITIQINDQNYDQVSEKSDDNYFSKNFDDCMKRLQLIEKEHELIEKGEEDLQFCEFKSNENKQIDDTPPETPKISQSEGKTCDESEHNLSNFESSVEEIQKSEINKNGQQKNVENVENKTNSTAISSLQTEDEGERAKAKQNETNCHSNLKKQFEAKEEDPEQRIKEVTCRITGATLKNQNENLKSDEKEKDTRHYFSRLVKNNKSLINDEELPDPDKVKSIRTMFQETLNSTLKRKLNKKLGGSLQNISTRPTEQQINRPLSAQCCRKDLFCEAPNQKCTPEKLTKTSKAFRDGMEDFQIENVKKKLTEKCEKDSKSIKDYRTRKVLQPKWTDTGSVSSGISSDLSSYDTDLDSYSREGTEQDEMTISDDDLLEEMKDKHYVQNEILEKIRSFGTSVTYFGGEMITCSVGPLLSPTTQAIMEEISEKYAQEPGSARSFDEFYKKYVETNELNRKKKLGRARSFGQSDVFQKPNTLSNTEIEMYKNDLEIEIGIKKPAGNTLKKVSKSTSLGSASNSPNRKKEKEYEFTNVRSESNFPDSNNTENNNLQNIDGNVQSDFKMEENNSEIVTNEFSESISLNNVENQKNDSEENKTETKLEKEELYKKCFDKEPLYLRSKSAPEGLSLAKTSSNQDIVLGNNENSDNKIFFSYEKKNFIEKRKPDMEFEEFEVCESLSEKLDKLDKINSGKSEETNSDTKKQLQKNNLDKFQLHVDIPSTENCEDSQETNKQCSGKPNLSRWPIETTVMVDIQKNNELTPKLITNGKSTAKTKLRFF